MLTQQHIQERLSLAYIHAVVGRAGANLGPKMDHDYGIDGSIFPIRVRNGRPVQSGFGFDFQVKSTTRWALEGDYVVYDLEAKTFNDIVSRDPAEMALVLFVLCLPHDENAWLNVCEDSLTLCHGCYWLRIPPGRQTMNRSTVRVWLPRQNLLDVAGLNRLLVEIGDEMKGRRDGV